MSNSKEYKKMIGMCMGCGCTDSLKLSVSALLPTMLQSIHCFGADGNYVDNVEIECTRNYLVLCGKPYRGSSAERAQLINFSEEAECND
jgi:hypothetical protein